jgi:hypothetical protein
VVISKGAHGHSCRAHFTPSRGSPNTCAPEGHGVFDFRRAGHITTVGFIERPPMPKGSEQDRVKRRYLDERRQAVNEQGGFGH